MNSIIYAYRNRPSMLRACLRSIELFSKTVPNKSFEIVLVDLGSENSKPIVKKYDDLIPLKYYWIDYKGIFWKTKALNYGVKRCSGDIVTILDIDGLIGPSFLSGTHCYFSDPSNTNTRLSHRVRIMYGNMNRFFSSNDNFTEKDIYSFILNRIKLTKMTQERYSVECRLLRDIPKDQHTPYLEENEVVGCSHCSLSKDNYISIGGCNEEFIGHGCEDLEFNLRCMRKLKVGRMLRDPEYNIFHIEHSHGLGWTNSKNAVNNSLLFKKTRTENLISIPIGERWGEF